MKKTAVLIGMLVFALVVGFSFSGYAACKAGDKADVLWKGTWYSATVKKAKGDKCYIHYDGYGSNWDEWVGPDRIKTKGKVEMASSKGEYSVGDSVDVSWKGSWYPANIIAVGKNKWKIHYDGYGSNWDEWVTASRIRTK